MEAEIPWWQEAKASSLTRRAASAAAACGVKPGDAFLIVTEGTVTEPVYFELLRKELQLSAVSIRVQPGAASHPRHVIETAAKEVKEHARRAKRGRLANTEPNKYDHVWAVIDTDVAVREGICPISAPWPPPGKSNWRIPLPVLSFGCSSTSKAILLGAI